MTGDDGFAWLRALELRLLRKKVERLSEARDDLAADEQRELRERAAAKLASGSHLTREEVAAHLGVSPKKIQRMDTAGTLPRCPDMGTVVRYAAREVLRLASASSRKGA
jgi:predicted DNA-binding transcriptional regulator AlpA